MCICTHLCASFMSYPIQVSLMGIPAVSIAKCGHLCKTEDVPLFRPQNYLILVSYNVNPSHGHHGGHLA